MFLHNWSNIDGLIYDFALPEGSLDDINVLLASYTYEDYSGNAFVLFEKDGIVYEVNGSHCSCYGLEEQWQPEIADLDELKRRVTVGTFGSYYGHDEYRDALRSVLESLESAYPAEAGVTS